ENGPVPLATWLQSFDPAPFDTRRTSSLVLDQPHNDGPKFDLNFAKTNADLVSARTALQEQIRCYVPPPYAACGAPDLKRLPGEDMAAAGEITRLLARVREGDL